MTKDARHETSLPVTGEVGSEGGSYADPTTQVATFEGDVAHHDEPAADLVGEESDTAEGMRKHPTEP